MPLLTLPFIILAVIGGMLAAFGRWLFEKIFRDDDKEKEKDDARS
jgi:fluoride ion exporter CrcB/FEX